MLPAAQLSRRDALRRLGLLGILAPTVASLLAACSAAQPSTAGAPAATAQPKSKILIGIVQEPTSLDPTADATNSIAVCLRDNVYEGLVRLDEGGKLVPSLARQLPSVSDEGRTLTFQLASGVKWHDGSAFTADDVKFSWDRARDPNATPKPNPHLDYWAPVQSVDVVDPTTVKVTLKQYSDNWLFHMASGSACIVSKTSFATNITNPVGTGPFKYAAWNRGGSLTLTRNDDYWGDKARLKDVEFRFISDPNAMNNALKAGDIDAMGQVGGPEQVDQFKQDPNFQVLQRAAFGKTMVSVNNTSGPLQDKRVRQALYAAIDRKAWIDGIIAGLGVPIGSHATPNDGEPYYADMTGVNTYDPQKARQLLADAGQSSLRLRLAQITSLPYAVRGTDILNSQLQAVGITLDVQPMDFARWLAEVLGGGQNYDLTIINHIEERDIGNYANPKYYWHYANPQVTDGLTQADAEPDETRRKALYTQVQQQLADDAANLWIYAAYQLAILKKGVSDWQVQGISPSLFLGKTSLS